MGTKKRKRSQLPPRKFNNQETLTWNGKSIKVFRNGSLHVTGCTSVREFMRCMSAVCGLVESTCDDAGDVGPLVAVEKFAIQMINLNFGVGAELWLGQLRETFVAGGYTATLDADKYPGLNVKLRIPGMERTVTVLLFKSGKVLMTGAKTAEELETAYAVLTDTLNELEKHKPCE